MLLVSFTTWPVTGRPSPVDNPHYHHILHDSTDIVLQQSEDMSTESQEQLLTEIKMSEEEETRDEIEDVDNGPAEAEDYPQQDMPAAGNTGGRKGEAKLPRSYHNGKSGRRNVVNHHSVAKPAAEGNDTNDGIPEEVNLEEANRTLSNGSASNTTTSDENYIKLPMNNRER